MHQHSYKCTVVHEHAAYHDIVGVINDNIKDILHQKCQTEQEPYYANSHTETTGIGAIVGTVAITLQLVSNTAKYDNGTELGVWEGRKGGGRRVGG